MFDYTTLKTLHVSCVVVSAALFVLRGALMVAAPARLQAAWARIIPHVVDTLLLAAAVGMLAVARINPFESSWLTAKIVALLVYIGLGAVALKRGRTLTGRLLAWAIALTTLAYIVAVALTKQAWPF